MSSDLSAAEFHEALQRARELQVAGRWQRALAALDELLRRAPGQTEALLLRGEVLQKLGRPDEAAAVFRRLASARPDSADAWTGLGSAQLSLHRLEPALQSFERALSLHSGDVRAWIGRGAALQRLSRWDEALDCYDGVRKLRPDLVGVLNNRALALSALGRWDEAATTYAELLDAAPDFPYALGQLQRSRRLACDWREHGSLRERIIDGIAAGKSVCDPFSFFAVSDSPAQQQACARLYAQRQHPDADAVSPSSPRVAEDGRIRLAYLSPDFHDHATAFLSAGLFEKHDRERFEIIAVSFGPDSNGPMRRRLREGFDHFIDVRAMGDREVAEKLRAMDVHIAVDLAGFTSRNRAGILAARPAPVQVSYLGYPGSMQAPFIDYLIADACVVPPGQEAFYRESIVRLPDCYQVNDDRRVRPAEAGTRSEHGLPDEAFVFCCFNNSYKIGPEIFAVWMRLLAQVPGSVLWLFEDNALAGANLRREAAACGIAPQRLVMAPRRSPAAHLARHLHADLFLDTFPYTAHTTGSDALWMGLPLVTRVGEGFASRVAGSLLRAVGLPELAVRGFDEYEALALSLAREPARLAQLRMRLVDDRGTHALFDTDHFRRHLETAYTTLWTRHLAGDSPCGFDVTA
ncbi:tetratricopeptide repeat protein [Arenimonas sp.]|uniref:O-linked N-acetylglucosamine transferase, SPINDLY family protein n=1 Tax=Arenimonas sp. TaxID=1872635 RepID=UPI0039E33557